MQREYWEALNRVLDTKGGPVAGDRTAQPESWMAYPIGKASFYIGAAMHTRRNWVKAELYMGGDEAKKIFGDLTRQKEEIERELSGPPLHWEQLPSKTACRICRYLPADPTKREDWKHQHGWLAEDMNDLHRIFSAASGSSERGQLAIPRM
jgi:hypothetical protein